jgi:hypothetical protein
MWELLSNNPFSLLAQDFLVWLKWLLQRSTYYLMPFSGLRVGFHFWKFQVRRVDWYCWGHQYLEPEVVYHDGQALKTIYFRQFCWVSRKRFLLHCALNELKLPKNCVWVVEEREL